MRKSHSRAGAAVLALSMVIGFRFSTAHAQFVLPATTANPGLTPAGANGDSVDPVLSADGRFVAFASAGDNLGLGTNSTVVGVGVPQHLNVFLYDRNTRSTVLVSATSSGQLGNADSVPATVSTNGQYVLFESTASNLVPGDTNKASDIFLRDVVNGITTLVSVSTNGTAGNNLSRSGAMSPDGRFVAFVSLANNLVSGDTNGISDIFLRDMVAGTTTWVSSEATRTRAGVGASERPEISDDGRYVTFYSTATNLVSGAGVNSEIYLRDVVLQTNYWVGGYGRSIVQSNAAASFNHSMTPDGSFVAYQTGRLLVRYNTQTLQSDVVFSNAAASLTLRADEVQNVSITPDGRYIAFVANTNGLTSFVQVWDAQTGVCTPVSADDSGTIQAGAVCDFPALDGSGRFVAFQSTANNLVTNALLGDYHVYLRDMQSGTIKLLDAAADGTGAGVSANTAPVLASDGSCTVLECKDSSLVPGDLNGVWDLFIRDLNTDSIELVSARDATQVSTTPAGFSRFGPGAASADGRYLVFSSDASNVVTNDTNGQSDVFIKDLADGSITLVSVGTNGLSPNGHSEEAAISPDGRYVAFRSTANLSPMDTNNWSDVYLKDLASGEIRLVSMNVSQTAAGSRDSYQPQVSSGGRFVLFRSTARDLVSSSVTASEGLYLRDMVVGTNYLLTNPSGGGATIFVPVMTPDGRYVLFADSGISNQGYLYLWDSTMASRIYTNQPSTTPVGTYDMTPDGKRVAFARGNAIYVSDIPFGTNQLLDLGTLYRGVHISADGQWVVGFKLRTGEFHLFLFNALGGAGINIDGDFPSGGSSDSPVISPDGRFIAFRSTATNLSGIISGIPQIYVFDRVTGVNRLVSKGLAGGGTDRSYFPAFSADGTRLLFGTLASDLSAGDLNHEADVMVYTLLLASIQAGTQGPVVSWPSMPGYSYQVQYKDALDAASWIPLTGSTTNVGARGFIEDTSASGPQRFYRVTIP